LEPFAVAWIEQLGGKISEEFGRADALITAGAERCWGIRVRRDEAGLGGGQQAGQLAVVVAALHGGVIGDAVEIWDLGPLFREQDNAGRVVHVNQVKPAFRGSVNRPAFLQVSRSGNAVRAIDACQAEDDATAAVRVLAQNLFCGKGCFSAFAGRLGRGFFIDKVAGRSAVNSGRADVNPATRLAADGVKDITAQELRQATGIDLLNGLRRLAAVTD